METIFDYNPTEEEWKVLYDGPMPEPLKEHYFEFDEDSLNMDLYRLFLIRKDYAKANHHLEQIKDREYAFAVSYNDLISE
jgi:hypothetical protein